MEKTEQQTKQQIITDAEATAIYRVTDNAETPPEVKKILLNYLREKTGISVEFSELESKQDKTQAATAGQAERIESDDEIRLTPERACELSEWIITQTTGIYSADAFDDRQKQAFLILLSAIVYEEDMTKRENILIDVTRKVFGYSFACDSAENLFVRNGFESGRRGEWTAES